jgi:hypothetical protein
MRYKYVSASSTTGHREAMKKTMSPHLHPFWKRAYILFTEIAVESKDTSPLQDVFRKIYAFSVMTLRSFQCFISRAKPHGEFMKERQRVCIYVTAVFLTNRGHKVSQPFNSVTLRSFSLDVLASYEIQDSGIGVAMSS